MEQQPRRVASRISARWPWFNRVGNSLRIRPSRQCNREHQSLQLYVKQSKNAAASAALASPASNVAAVPYCPAAHGLAQSVVSQGDRIRIHFFQTFAIGPARSDSPIPSADIKSQCQHFARIKAIQRLPSRRADSTNPPPSRAMRASLTSADGLGSLGVVEDRF